MSARNSKALGHSDASDDRQNCTGKRYPPECLIEPFRNLIRDVPMVVNEETPIAALHAMVPKSPRFIQVAANDSFRVANKEVDQLCQPTWTFFACRVV